MTALIQIAMGGALGASLRYMTSKAAARLLGSGFPWGTLTVNILGSFAMGLLAVLLAEKAPRLSLFLTTGLLGGFTTFSAFSLDTLALIELDQSAQAAAYVLASVALSLLAVFAGLLLAREIIG